MGETEAGVDLKNRMKWPLLRLGKGLNGDCCEL